jgi:hypothetical protein
LGGHEKILRGREHAAAAETLLLAQQVNLTRQKQELGG